MTTYKEKADRWLEGHQEEYERYIDGDIRSPITAFAESLDGVMQTCKYCGGEMPGGTCVCKKFKGLILPQHIEELDLILGNPEDLHATYKDIERLARTLERKINEIIREMNRTIR